MKPLASASTCARRSGVSGRRDEGDRGEALARRARRAARRSSSSGRSGTIAAGGAGARELAGEAADAAGENHVRVDHRQRPEPPAWSPAASRRSRGRRRSESRLASASVAGGVDDRPVGERVAVGHTELDQIGTGVGVGLERRRPRSRGRDSRPSGRASGPPAPRAAPRRRRRRSGRPVRRLLSARHRGRPSSASASARSLSPRPLRGEESRPVSAGRRSSSSQAIACEDSSAGTMPSSRESSRKARSAAASSTAT